MQPSLTPQAGPIDPQEPAPLSPEFPSADAPPIEETPPQEGKEKKGIVLPKEVMDFAYREARKNFALIPDMTFALKMASRALKENWDYKDGKFTRKEKPFSNYVPPKDDEETAEPAPARATPSPEIAEAHARWDEARRSGDPGRMTRTANNLLRAVEAVRQSDRSVEAGEYAEDEVDQAPQTLSEEQESGNAGLVESDLDPFAPEATLEPVAWVSPEGKVLGLGVEKPDEQHWTPAQRTTAQTIEGRIAAVGEAIQRHGTPEQKAAWQRINRLILQSAPLGTEGSAEYYEGALRIDLNQMGAPADPNNPAKTPQPPDPNYVTFMLVHEFFHATPSNQNALIAAHKMQGGKWQKTAPKIGTPQWSVEVRHDEMVYDFLIKSGLLPSPPPPIERIAPYYAEHLKNPKVPVHKFPVPGYDKPIG